MWSKNVGRMVLCGAILVAAMPGCAVIHRPPATVASLASEAPAILASERATIDTVVARMARRAVARGDRQLDI
ncbi:MAG: hypothetical protein ABUL71_03905, partial [Gemmatimonadota bacterium]